MLWALIFGVVAIALVMLGGMEAAQASAIIGGTPIIIVYIILGFSFRKMLKEDKRISEDNNVKNI